MAQDPQSKPRQIPVRLPEELIRVLEVARLATGAKSMQAFLSEIVERAVQEYGDQPEIRRMLESIEEYQARRDGRLRRIERPAKTARRRKS